MAEKDMRLRLVVRRDGLPEERLMWNVSLEDNPTISKLIEKVNETFPLEIGQKGLENYVVELRDQDGTSFECLHFQPIQSVLKPDDRVFIRGLDRDDNRRRRISGRHQISSDGRHLVDGIPFGRRLLRVPAGRPSIDPPRKRRKLLHPHEDLDDSLNDDEDTPMLLLTNGERPTDKPAFPSVKFSPKFDFIDAETEDGDFDNEAEAGDESGGSESDDYDQQNSEMLSDEDDLEQELRDLAEDDAIVEDKEPSDAQDSTRKDCSKVSALQAAFPSAPVSICENILATSGYDLKSAYDILASGFKPQLPESALSAGSISTKTASKLKLRKSQKDNSTKDTLTTYPEDAADDNAHNNEDVSDEDDGEQVSAFVRQFDHRGLPPGSITSGRGLAQMAAISSSFDSNKASGESETTSETLNGHKTGPEKTAKEDDTSSDATSSSSENEDSEMTSGSDSEDISSNGSNHNNDESDNSNDDDDDSSPKSSRDDMSSDSENESDDSSDDSDDGPEEISLRRQASNSQNLSRKRGLGHDNNLNQIRSSNDTSDSSDVSSDESSDGESSEAGSNSTSESEGVEETSNGINIARACVQTSPAGSVQTKPLQPPPNTVPQVQLVPPGAGNERTKRRNARRRAANKAKKLAQQGTIMSAMPTGEKTRPSIIDENALFEAKRQELLDAIASGGIEVGPLVPVDESSRISTSTKRKVDEHNDQVIQQDASAMTPVDEDANLSASVQKKLRVDIDAGRRLLFGALGLRNPKTKEDEDKLRDKLTRDIRPLDNPRLGQGKDDTQQVNEDGPIVEDDIECWKDKIIYRAVECCHEGVQLSEPPFPFVQRWDPQQQNLWSQKKNKRGGQSKRAQRNQGHFYQDNRSSKKRKHEESDMWDEEGYDDTFNGMDDYSNDADIELNYDDTEACQPREANRPMNDASQFTDMDDLPSLPSDLSALPALRPGEVQVGMVITWQQWSCSSATSWQPQVSNVTGVVVRIDDDATGLEVCLAKRDRYLDRNQKKYDENTGQRIYDKFEAPDLDDDDDYDDEDEGEDEGFRTIGFAEMQQPKILQQPLPIVAPNEKPNAAGSLPEANSNTRSESPTVAEDVKFEAHLERERSSTKESTKENTSGVACVGISSSGQTQHHSNTSASNPLQVNSPSRQLRESTNQSVGIQAGTQLPVQDTSSRDIDSDGPSARAGIEVPRSELPSMGQSSAPLFDSHEDEVVAGTPKVVRSRAIVPPSSVSSARSGRQLDYTLDMEVTEPDSLKITDDGISTALDTEYQQDIESDEDISTPTPTPTPTPFLQEESAVGQETTAQESELRSSAEPSTPSSLSSINTVWCTALTSRNTQSPSKSQPQSQSQSLPPNGSQKIRAQKDQDYEEATWKLDNTSYYQTSSSRVPGSFERVSRRKSLDSVAEDGIVKAPSKSPPIKTSPPPIKKRKLPKESSQFTLPPGTQVVELSSDSEPVYTENYADDEVDGTYSPDLDSLPRGNGWVHKRTDPKNGHARRVTSPIRFQPPKRRKFISSSQGPLSTSPSTSVSNFGPIKPRRKTSSKF